MFRLIFSVATIIVISGPAAGQNQAAEPAPKRLEGPARALEGDTIEINGYTVWVAGIDAPEMQGDTRGPVSRAAMDDLLAGRQVVCEISGKSHDHLVGQCRAGGRDLGEAMVRSGWAFEHRQYSADYGVAEAEARAAGRGFWADAAQRVTNAPLALRWASALAPIVASIAAAVAAGIVVWLYYRRRRHETQDLAAALMGEITSLVRIAQFRKYLEIFEQIKARAEADEPWEGVTGFDAQRQDYFEVFSKNVERLGMLSGDLPERTAMMYTMGKAVMEDLAMIRSGVLNDTSNPARAYMFGQLIVLLQASLEYGMGLAADLAAASGRPAPQFYLPPSDDAGAEAPVEEPAANGDQTVAPGTAV